MKKFSLFIVFSTFALIFFGMGSLTHSVWQVNLQKASLEVGVSPQTLPYTSQGANDFGSGPHGQKSLTDLTSQQQSELQLAKANLESALQTYLDGQVKLGLMSHAYAVEAEYLIKQTLDPFVKVNPHALPNSGQLKTSASFSLQPVLAN